MRPSRNSRAAPPAVRDDERTDLEERIRTKRYLMGGQDPITRFLGWTVPDEAEPEDPDVELDDDDDDDDDEEEEDEDEEDDDDDDDD